MSINALNAANAYGNVLKNSGNITKGNDEALSLGGNKAGGSAFDGLVSAALGDTSKALNASAEVAVSQMNKKADLVDVVTTVQNAEMVLNTVVAVRYKVIIAYQDIIKMPM
jgi:flagellar hook-basal body complex protein FliE